jgi:hypothetical protein
MKNLSLFLVVLLSFLPLLISAQGKPNYVGEWYKRAAQGKKPEKANVFTPGKSDFPKTKRYNVKANINQLNSIMNKQPELVDLVVPYGDKTYTLNLAKVEITSEEFNVRTDKGSANHKNGVQYRGIVNNNPSHLASLSLTQTDKSAFFSTDEGNFVITREGVDFIVYNDQEMDVPVTSFCEALPVTSQMPAMAQLISGVGCKTVKVYFECDYAFFQNKGSVSAVTNYVMSFFNQVATLYANEDVSIQVSEVFVWTTTDPYAAKTSNSDILNTFRANRGTTFNGHIAHFLTTRTPLGGIAYVDALCNKAYAYGVSRVSGTYSNFPTYSWTVNVVAHELGHTLASPHTHSCSWSIGALDNCQAPEGSCAAGPAPVNGGTIMSYCHLTGTGINFNNGFGLYPGNLIRSRVQNASCIPSGTAGTPPTSLSTNNITSSSATLSWAPVSGATSYQAQYKLSSASTWTTASATSATSITISGLTPGAAYMWAVKADCSPYSSSVSFSTSGTTGCAVPTQLTSSGISQSGVTLSWSPVSGATGYTVQYKTSAATTWTTANATASSIAISGLAAGTNYVWQVKANCSAYSTQASFTTTSGTTGCNAPVNLSSTGISASAATLIWSAVTGATGYTVQYRKSSVTTWTTVSAVASSISISGLTSSTNYVWQVKANCSSYSTQASFTTTSGTTGCTTPTGLSSINITSSGATLTWTAVPGATSYTVQYRKSTTTTWTSTSSSTNSRSISALTAGANYVWRVKANCSTYSSQASFTTASSTSGGCAMPTGQGVTNITTNSAILTWTGPTNALSYSIRYKPVGFSGWTILNGVTGNSRQITGLQSRRSYEWIINTKCTNGTSSAFTSSKTFTTL